MHCKVIASLEYAKSPAGSFSSNTDKFSRSRLHMFNKDSNAKERFSCGIYSTALP